jgi:hypothetical protein
MIWVTRRKGNEMATFGSAEEYYGVLTPFLEQITKDPEIAPKFVVANTSFRVNYTDPEATFLLDATQDPPVVLVGDAAMAAEPEVELSMSSDDGHKFWLGKLNIPVALARRKVKVTGPIGKLLGMLPAIQPAFARYQTYLKESGHDALV